MPEDTANQVVKPADTPSPVATATPAAAPAPAAAKIEAAPKPAPSAPVAKAAPVAPAKLAPVKLVSPKPTKPAAKLAPKKMAAPVKRVAPRKTAAAISAAPKMKEIKMETNIKAAADKAQDQAKTMFAEANTRAKSAMEKGSKMVEEMNIFTKGNVEAVVESTKIYAKGVESMGQDAAAFAKKQYEDMTAAFKSFSGAKSPTEFFKLQSDFARTQFDAMIAQSSKSTEKMIKLAGEVAQPISNRVALAAEKIKIAA